MKVNDVYVMFDKYESTDYFDFPSTVIAFSKSMKTSNLFVYSDYIFFRKYGKTLTLITYFCSSQKLFSVLKKYSKLGYKIKVLNCVNKDMGIFKKNSYGKEFWIDKSYDFKLGFLKSRTKRKMRNKLLRSSEKYYVDYNFSFDEFLDLFDKWFDKAKERHFMVVKGHYISYVRLFFSGVLKNVKLIGYRTKKDNSLYAVSGYEVWNGNAQITVMKHIIGDNNFSKYFWLKTLEIIMENGVDKIFCGSTADGLKSQLGMNFYKSYKIKLEL